ncbi:hypothetical protein FOYG_00124 [Fusarium oxysporum NRRL 32931]|uniref:Fungal N-terminal domain-containing protein n=1 Tax=Fusarium oxysporum NRRL 32931 TaxID=660029 RepID=W9J5Z5_FUSOX|nr:hypothetical protein FOYG_00124 [Fusarium oxysporum NRRL 32931]
MPGSATIKLEKARELALNSTMDPFSIAAGCVGFYEAVVRTVPVVISFIHSVNCARDELSKIYDQLQQLNLVLCRIQQAIGPKEDTSDQDRDLIFTIINRCLEAVKSINTITEDHTKWFGPGKWALYGKEKCQLISKSLEESIRDLNLVLQGRNSTVLHTILMQNNLSALQSDDMQRDVGTILGDTEYLKRQASEQTDTIAAMSQTISKMHTLLLQKTMLSGDEYTFQDSQRKRFSNSDSIFRHFHYSASESEENSSMENYDFNEYLGTDQSSVAEQFKWEAENCSFVSSGDFPPYTEAPGIACQDPLMAVKSLGKSAESPIAAKFKTDVHAKARAANPKGTQHLCLSPNAISKGGKARRQNVSLQNGSPEQRSIKGQMVIHDFQRQVRARRVGC